MSFVQQLRTTRARSISIGTAPLHFQKPKGYGGGKERANREQLICASVNLLNLLDSRWGELRKTRAQMPIDLLDRDRLAEIEALDRVALLRLKES